MQLYVDMDGVLANFDAGYEKAFGIKPDKQTENVDWKLVSETPGFYASLPPMPDMQQLWSYIEKHDPIILTGLPKDVPEAFDNKMAWVEKHLGQIMMIGCPSKDKNNYADPGDILIDDWEKYRHLWVAKGGIWITHRSATETIIDLMAAGVM